ncbi:MAG: hypothetical protein Q8755_02590, partial [Candidatus Phytoplasma australasiaticum]|nr:hypothetical protein [Candidatus Phytoplasma australasiaticum]
MFRLQKQGLLLSCLQRLLLKDMVQRLLLMSPVQRLLLKTHVQRLKLNLSIHSRLKMQEMKNKKKTQLLRHYKQQLLLLLPLMQRLLRCKTVIAAAVVCGYGCKGFTKIPLQSPYCVSKTNDLNDLSHKGQDSKRNEGTTKRWRAKSFWCCVISKCSLMVVGTAHWSRCNRVDGWGYDTPIFDWSDSQNRVCTPSSLFLIKQNRRCEFFVFWLFI